jgi:hypothetical protein
MRKLIGLLALLMVLGAIAVPASAAAEEVVVEGSKFVVQPTSTSEMAPDSLSQCSANTMCVWENNDFTGNFSWWAESNTGCHSHLSNPKLRSGWNRTGYRVRVGGALYLYPGESFRLIEGNPITGEVCFPA